MAARGSARGLDPAAAGGRPIRMCNTTNGTMRLNAHGLPPMHARSVPGLRVTCRDCGRTAPVAEDALAAWLGEAPTMRTIRAALGHLVCSACGSRRYDAWVAGAEGRQLLDADHTRTCRHCGLPRLLDELRARPTAEVCALCAELAKAEEEAARAKPWPMPPAGHEKCPRCGRPTIVRESKDAPGAYFLGCTGFPACRWTGDMPEG